MKIQVNYVWNKECAEYKRQYTKLSVYWQEAQNEEYKRNAQIKKRTNVRKQMKTEGNKWREGNV